MKYTYKLRSIIILCIFVGYSTLAQKIDLDKVLVKNEYISLPENGALLSYNTYVANFQIDPGMISQLGLTGSKITGYGTLNGFGHNTEEPDFIYALHIGKPVNVPGTVEERKSEVKNAAGQLVTVIKYVAKLRQSIPTTISVTDQANGKEIFKKEFGKAAAPFEVPSQEFDNRAQAEAFLNVKEGALHATILNNYRIRLEGDIAQLQRTFTPKKKEDEDPFWEVDLKKAPEYADFNQQVAKAKTILEKQSYNQSLDKSREEFIPILKFWSENVTKVQLKDAKAQKKLKYAYLINLAKSQFWLEQFDDCEKTCKQIIENEYDKEDGKDLLAAVARVKAELQSAKVPSRHFYRKGFEDQSKFDYGNITKNTAKSFKASLGDIKKSAKKDLVRKTVKDTIDAHETDLSDFKFKLNGDEMGLKHNQLKNGSGSGIPEENGTYKISFSKAETILPIDREVDYFDLNLYPNMTVKPGFNAADMLALLKEYNGKDLLDINIGNDSISYSMDHKITSSKVILPKDYAQKLSVDASIKINHKENSALSGTYRTNTGDKFKIQVLEAIPVTIGARAQYLQSKAYLVTLLIPELRLNKIQCVEPWCYLNGETITIQNVTCTLLMLSR